MDDLMQVSKALNLILSEFKPVQSETVSLEHAATRVLSADVESLIDLPIFDNSSMDGFAIRASDITKAKPDNPVFMKVVTDIPAGVKPPGVINMNEAARIVTGAMIPNGADTVIPVEDTSIGRFEPGSESIDGVYILRAYKKGENVRLRGQDTVKGEKILTSGKRIRPQDLGILAAQGIPSLNVFRHPKIGLFSSGNELIKPGQEIQPGQIYDSNSYTLSALIQNSGCKNVNFGTYADSAIEIKNAFDEIFREKVDLIISSAGVSMGAYDFVRSVIEQDGNLKLWRVNMRPGKPLVFGSYRNIPFVGLPGNPVSAFIGFEVFVKPIIGRLSGLSNIEREIRKIRLSHSVVSDGRESYLRGNITRINGNWVGTLAENQGSGNLMSLVNANAIIIIPSGITKLPPNSLVDAWHLK